MTTMLDARRNFFRASYDNLLLEGYLWIWDFDYSIATGASLVFSFTTGPDFPVILKDTRVIVNGTRDVRLDFYSGGVLSGGNLIPVRPRNFYLTKPSPYLNNEVYEGRNIDTPGTLLFSQALGEQDLFSTDISRGTTVMEINTQIYIVLTNNEEQAASKVGILAGNLT